MGVELKALELSENGSLRDCASDPSPIAKRFAEIFTKYYDELCDCSPILSKMQRDSLKLRLSLSLCILKEFQSNFHL